MLNYELEHISVTGPLQKWQHYRIHPSPSKEEKGREERERGREGNGRGIGGHIKEQREGRG